MIEGRLYASTNPGNYAIGSPYNPDLTEGQAVELLLGGHWISGSIAYSDRGSVSSTDTFTNTMPQDIGAYHIASDDGANGDDIVIEASEESFPASDPPSCTGTSVGTSQPTSNVVNGYYFIAESDHSVCGLCIGMQIRVHNRPIK